MEVNTLQEKIYRELREAVASGEFQPGERLVETRLAERLGSTRGPVREALCRLEHDGVVVRHPGVGVFVTEFDKESFLEVCEIRAALEALAARKAAERCDEIGAARLRRELDKLRQRAQATADGESLVRRELLALDVDLHLLIAEIAERPLLRALLANQHIIRGMIQDVLPLLPEAFSKAEVEGVVERHARLVEAIIARCEDEAEELGREHVMHVLRNAMPLLEGRDLALERE